jgi:hypothetical protein
MTVSIQQRSWQMGHATAHVHISGILHGETPQGSAALSFALATNRTFPELLENFSGRADHVDGPYYEAISETYAVPIDFVWGTSFQLVVRGVTRVGVGSVFGGMPTGSTAGTDFGHTIYWDGLDNVSANGDQLDTYGLSAASGADYRQSFGPQADAPEPGRTENWPSVDAFRAPADGIAIGALGLRDPDQRVVLPHEDVMPGPVADRLELMRAARANVEARQKALELAATRFQ